MTATARGVNQPKDKRISWKKQRRQTYVELIEQLLGCPQGEEAALLQAPPSAGTARPLTRGDLSWQISVPDEGSLPFGGAFPTLLQWAEGTHHPSERLPDSGCRLALLEISHPAADVIKAMISLDDDRVDLTKGAFAMQATFETPHGMRILS